MSREKIVVWHTVMVRAVHDVMWPVFVAVFALHWILRFPKNPSCCHT